MDFAQVKADRHKVEEFLQRHRIGLVTLLFTDIVGSTKLKQTLGDVVATMQIHEHHVALREVLRIFKEAQEISTAGDSFFVVFARPSDAVKFSLLLQSRLRQLAQETGVPLLDRIGIHVGEVIITEPPTPKQGKDLYGIHVDTCARLMSLAQGDQIFMSRMVFDNARQILRGQELPGVGPLSWLSHGPYVFHDVEDPLELCEVGEKGNAGLARPADTNKAHRHVSPDSEPVLGWRPALGQAVPNSRWVLEEKLGDGGFGEVWLARHETLKDRRVLKFCFRADRVRSLKREATIFKLLRDRVGPHPGIVTVHDLFLDTPPFYLVMDYVPGRDLRTWAVQQGGLKQVPLATRMEVVCEVAEALQAAHECGIIHRDVKPSNVLVEEVEGRVRAKLTDFGIGQVTTEEALIGLTKLGFTQTLVPGSSSAAGTQTYMAPEVLAGKPATTLSDIYSLGVLLYQMTVGEWNRPVTVDWARGVADPLLREDLARCFAGDPEERLASAGALAQLLRAHDVRRAALTEREAALAVREKTAHQRKLVQKWSVALLLVGLAALLIFLIYSSRYGNIVITSEPSGAAIWESDQLMGTTPYRANNIRAGKLSYRVQLEGYVSSTLNLEVGTRATTEWNAVLRKPGDPVPTSWELSAAEGPAEIRILGLQGSVEVMPAGATFGVLIQTNQVLQLGDRLKVGQASTVTLRMADRSVVRFGSLAEVNVVRKKTLNGLREIEH